MGVLALMPGGNIAHWIPHALLDEIGVSYAAQLWFEQHVATLAHGVGGMLLMATWGWSTIEQRLWVGFIVITIGCLGVECLQWWIGRGFSVLDLLTGSAGAALMALLLTFKKLRI